VSNKEVTFLKKSNQKTFAPWTPGVFSRGADVFCAGGPPGCFFQNSDRLLE
jgi:hypothetical protein